MPATRPALPDRYLAPELIEHGGMAEVYFSRDRILGRSVAIKVLAERYATNEEFRARFLREARTAASLADVPHVVVIHDVGEGDDGLPYIVMEYVPGGTLADRLRVDRVGIDVTLAWLEQAALALDRAHQRGVIHRDIKPGNLLVADDGTIRVTDFGIARAANNSTLTADGTILGSSGYMAPEQARGEPARSASDRYAFACVAFELLTGRRPFERDNPTAEAAAHATEAPPWPRRVDASLPATLDGVFARALAKSPGDRYPTCAEFVADIRWALQPSAPVETVGSSAPVTTVIRRHSVRPTRRVAGLLVLLPVLFLVGAALAWALAAFRDSSDAVVVTHTAPGETVIRTQTLQGETVVQTVTQSETVVVTEPTTATPSSPPAGESPRLLNDRAFRLLQQGDAGAALPLLETAVAALRDTSSITEAYASYNLALARFTVGRCDGLSELLDRSEEIQGHRIEIDRLRAGIEERCRE
jgi:tRNA A-37 threonylcarbamoyl transferase component Bud32